MAAMVNEENKNYKIYLFSLHSGLFQTLMNVQVASTFVNTTAPTALDHIYAAVILAIG